VSGIKLPIEEIERSVWAVEILDSDDGQSFFTPFLGLKGTAVDKIAEVADFDF